MKLLALGPQQTTLWWVALGIGLVVELVALSLLEFLLGLVKTIDAGVLQVWEMGKRVAANTATTWMFNQTAQLAEDLERQVAVGTHEAPVSAQGNGGPQGQRGGPQGQGGGPQDQGPERQPRRSVPRKHLT
jgi:hypothetical protein